MNDSASESAAYEPPSTFTHGEVKVAGRTVRYLEAGSGAPLIYLHGAGGLVLGHAHELLAENFRVIAIELPGFGLAAQEDGCASVAEVAQVIAEVIDILGIESYTLHGMSLGGAVALRLAVTAPAGLDTLILEAPSALRPPGEPTPPPADPVAMERALSVHPERRPPQPELDAGQQAHRMQVGGRLFKSIDAQEFERDIPAIQVPTLVVFGVDDGLIPPAVGARYRELMPSSHLVLVHDAAHEVSSDRPEAFVGLVGDFVRRRDGFLIDDRESALHP